MVCARKIHDEFNIFSGLCENFSFVAVWFFICLGQIGISYSGRIFRLHPDGLSPVQHATAAGFALAVFFINAISKCLPDWIICFQLGPDTVFDRNYGGNKENKEGAVDDESKAGTAINDE